MEQNNKGVHEEVERFPQIQKKGEAAQNTEIAANTDNIFT